MIVDIVEVSHAGVLHDVSLTLAAAELAVLAGRSGSGKTTLCHLIAGIMPPSGGRVSVNDRPAHSVKDWAEVSLLPQRLALDPELTVAENVLLPAGLRGRPAETDLLDRLGLTPIAGRPARDTSVGEQQRTAIARALVHDPRIVIADEPAGNLDPLISWEIIQLLLRINELGVTVLMATHDADVVTALRKRVVALEDGRVIRDEVGGGYHRRG
jgi:ABC-type multidrug transport system ATPase subunit